MPTTPTPTPTFNGTPAPVEPEHNRWTRAGVIISVITVVIATIIGVLQLTGQAGRQQTINGDGNSSTSGDDSPIINNVGPPPHIEVVPGLEIGTWKLLIRNFKPFTTVDLYLSVNGQDVDLGENATREVGGDGDAGTKERHWFWCTSRKRQPGPTCSPSEASHQVER